jgi:long-chain fatty acid transport protein
MKYTKIATAVVAVLGMGFSLQAYATNGMNSEGTGVKSRGMGGAGLAMSEEVASAVNNPAAVIDIGNRMDVALGLFSPNPRSYNLTGNTSGLSGTQESDKKIFAIPFFGMTFPIDPSSAWALTISANGGMNTDYATNFSPGFGGVGPTGINLEQLFIAGTYGRKVSDSTTLGISAIVAYQTFEAKGLQGFASLSSDSANLSNNGKDSSTGLGVKVGIQGKVSDTVSLGASYQPKINMKAFDKYKGLFADHGDLDIAATLAAGVAWKASPQLTVALDYLNIDYKGVTAIGNSTSLANTMAFGSSNGPGFGWDSINVFKLGFQYGYSDDWTLRAGWNHGDNPIKSSEVTVNFLAPGVITDHLTLGGTYKMDKASELSFNFVRSFSHSVTGAFAPYSNLGAFGGGTMTLEMSQNYVEMGYAKKF